VTEAPFGVKLGGFMLYFVEPTQKSPAQPTGLTFVFTVYVIGNPASNHVSDTLDTQHKFSILAWGFKLMKHDEPDYIITRKVVSAWRVRNFIVKEESNIQPTAVKCQFNARVTLNKLQTTKNDNNREILSRMTYETIALLAEYGP